MGSHNQHKHHIHGTKNYKFANSNNIFLFTSFDITGLNVLETLNAHFIISSFEMSDMTLLNEIGLKPIIMSTGTHFKS